MQMSDWSLYSMSLFAWRCFLGIRNNNDQDQHTRLIFDVLLQLP